MSNDDDTLLTTGQLAAVRGIGQARIRKERLKGDGPPFIRDGRLVRYRLGDYRAWLASKQRFQSTSEMAVA
jgi:predicted DNA-binding transcriptional regulator AlpA